MTRKFESFDDYKRHLRNKWGLGAGSSYKPWFTTLDVKGPEAFRSQIFGLKTCRTHHFLSSIETQLFYILEFRDDVIDIREQFPLLPLELSQKIAYTLGIKHPEVRKSGIPFVMSTDLLVSVKKEQHETYMAFAVKPEEKLSDPRVMEKLEIERVWWELLGVPFAIYTGNKSSSILSRNIAWATDPLRSQLCPELHAYTTQAAAMLSLGKHLKADICDGFAQSFALNSTAALNLLRILIAEKRITLDMSYLFEEATILSIQRIDISILRISGED